MTKNLGDRLKVLGDFGDRGGGGGGVRVTERSSYHDAHTPLCWRSSALCRIPAERTRGHGKGPRGYCQCDPVHLVIGGGCVW